MSERAKRAIKSDTNARRVPAATEQLALAFSMMGDPALVFDANWIVAQANAAAGQAFGFDPTGVGAEELVERLDVRNKSGARLSRAEIPLARALAGETVASLPVTFVGAERTRRDVLVSVAPMRSGERVVGAVAVVRDVTERQRLASELQAQRELFEAVVQNAPAAIAALSGPELVYTIVNPAYQAIAPGKEMIGRRWADVWPEVGPAMRDIAKDVWRTGKPVYVVDAPVRIQRRHDGPVEDAWFTFTLAKISSPPSDALLLLGTETTDHVRARNRAATLADTARKRSAELHGVLDNMVEGVFVVTPDARVKLANRSGAAMFGWEPADVVGRSLDELREVLRVRKSDGTPLKPEEVSGARALKGETVDEQDLVARHPRTGRDLQLRTSAAPIWSDTTASGAVAVFRDVTASVELDRAKAQFLTVAAHELKTPVTVMKGFAQALLRTNGARVPVRERKMLEAIDRGANRIDRITRDLLDASQLLAGRIAFESERFDLMASTHEAVANVLLAWPKREVRVAGVPHAFVRGDPARVEQVLTDLLDNAIRYSPDGGEIGVEVAVTAGKAVVSVIDHGVGIPANRQALIFQRFYRAHTGTPYDFGGIGIGLFLSREIVTRLGGEIWFESQEGVGSVFHFSVPLEQPEAAVAEELEPIGAPS